MTGEIFGSEREFTERIIDLAIVHGWEEPFHIPSSAYENALSSGGILPGFPDLLLRRRQEDGSCVIIVAELKTDDEESSRASAEQLEFLRDFARQGIPAFLLRYRDLDYFEQVLRDGPPESSGEIIEPSLPIIRSKPWAPSPKAANAIVGGLIREICASNFPSGDLAQLRRMDIDFPDAAPFWKIVADEGLSRNHALERHWAMITQGIALMAPNAHDRNISVGEALFVGGDPNRTTAFYSDLRLKRLLKARGRVLRTLLTQLFRMMTSAGQPFNWFQMASLILSETRDSKDREEIRRVISRSYYGEKYRRGQQA